MTVKYICNGCEEKCVLEVERYSSHLPRRCPWGTAAPWEKVEAATTARSDKASAEKLKSEINKILSDVLSGVEQKYRFERNFIRWGLVEAEIRQKIDAAFQLSQPRPESQE